MVLIPGAYIISAVAGSAHWKVMGLQWTPYLGSFPISLQTTAPSTFWVAPGPIANTYTMTLLPQGYPIYADEDLWQIGDYSPPELRANKAASNITQLAIEPAGNGSHRIRIAGKDLVFRFDDDRIKAFPARGVDGEHWVVKPVKK